jgi:hypothetical protein
VKHRRLIGSVAALVLVAGGVAAVTGAAGAVSDHPNVTICHAEDFGNAQRPYIQITPNTFGDLNGHTNHDGPLFQAGVGGPQAHWGDIIPPFDFPAQGQSPGGHFDGLNWTAEGQAIFDNGCVPVTETVTPAGTPNPSQVAGESATASPSQVSGESATASPATAVSTSPAFTG